MNLEGHCNGPQRFAEWSPPEGAERQGRVETPNECADKRVKRPKFLLTTEQFNHHFSQDQFMIKLRRNQLNICGETGPHGLN